MVIYRRHLRLELEFPVTLSTSSDELAGRTSDVSVSGARVLAPDLIPLGSRVHVRLRRPGAPRMWAEVLRAERHLGEWELGLEFRTPSLAARSLWSHMILEALLQRGAQGVRTTLAAPIRSLQALDHFITRELARGEAFWATPNPPEAGAIVDIVFSHPIDGSRYVAPMYVTSSTEDGFYASLAMFDEAAFLRFVERGLRQDV